MAQHPAKLLSVSVPRFRTFAFGAAALLASCAVEPSPRTQATIVDEDRPLRVVSLDYCADQFVLKLADRDQIAGVSPDAIKAFSYMRTVAEGVSIVRSRGEDVIALKPDLVVRSYGGGPNIEALLARSGIKTAQIGYAADFDGIRANITQIGGALGQNERAREVIQDMDRRLSQITPTKAPRSVLYLTPSGVTSGSGSLVDVLINQAGFTNFEKSRGWKSIPLERLVYEKPDVIAYAAFNQSTINTDLWSPMRHPIAISQLRAAPLSQLEGAWTACGGWFLVDAVEALAATRSNLEANHGKQGHER